MLVFLQQAVVEKLMVVLYSAPPVEWLIVVVWCDIVQKGLVWWSVNMVESSILSCGMTYRGFFPLVLASWSKYGLIYPTDKGAAAYWPQHLNHPPVIIRASPSLSDPNWQHNTSNHLWLLIKFEKVWLVPNGPEAGADRSKERAVILL